jgi:zinc transporter ZupT
MPLAGGEHAHGQERPLLFGIAIHHIPAAFALASVMIQNHVSRNFIIAMLIVFALMTPAGSILSQYVQDNSLADLRGYHNYFMAVVIGIFFHISTTILFESSEDHHFNLYKMFAILAGAGIAIINFFIG